MALGSLWLDLHLVCVPLSLVVLLGVILCVFVQWGGVRSIRRSLIPRMALGLLLEFLIPTGRPRFLFMVVGSVWRGVRSGSVVGGWGAGSLVLCLKMRRHAFAESSYCSWSGELEIMASLTLLGLVYTTKCCCGCPAERVVWLGSAGLMTSTSGRFAFNSCSHTAPSCSSGLARRSVLRK